MRTLKKVLALTVVLATLLSISAFAAFSDEESINENFVDAVNLLGALNVMTGDTEGTFRPNETISRAEAAKMIYVIRNGGVDDKAEGWTGMSTFSDVTPGVWYEGYVNYCASIGIIDGIGGGLFNPSGAVTGVELAKMMLVVADYRSDVEGYTGAGWNLNVIRDAQSAGMFKGYTLAYSAAATREQAAQLFANAILETEMAVYIGDVRVNSAAYLGSAETVGGRFFDLAIQTGVLTKVPHVDLQFEVQDNDDDDFENDEVSATAGEVSTLNANDKLSTIESFNDRDHLAFIDGNGNRDHDTAVDFEFDADPDLLYQEVDVIYQEANEGGILDRKSKVYAVLPTGNSDVYDVTMDAITVELRDDTKAMNDVTGTNNYNPLTIQFEGYNGGRAKTLPANFTLPVVKNLYEHDVMDVEATDVAKAEWDNEVFVVAPEAINMIATTSTAPIRLIDIDADGELDVAFVTTPYYGTVTNYDADRFEFTTDAELVDGENITSDRREADFDNFTFEDDIEKDDVIAVTLDVLSGEMLYNVSLVEATTGNLTHVYSTLPDNEIVVGGETYGFYGLKFGNETLEEADLNAERYHSDLGEEVTFYTDGKYILTAEVAPVTLGSNFAFVKNYNVEGNSFDSMLTDSRALLLELVLPDGSTVVKEYDREEVTDNTTGWYDEPDLVDRETDPANPAATDLLGEMVGKLVEYSSSGNYVAIRESHRSDSFEDEDRDDLQPNYHTDSVNKYVFNSSTGIFRFDNTAGRADITAFNVNETSVFFLPELYDDARGLAKDNIKKVTVINGDELRGQPSITVGTETEGNDYIMQLVTSLQSGVRTAAFGVLDVGSGVSDTGIYAYTLTRSWDQDPEDDDDGYRIQAVLSDVDEIDEDAILKLTGDDIIANKIYEATRNSDGSYDFDEIGPGSDMRLGSIDGREGNNVTIDDSLYVVTDDTQIFVVNTKGSRVRISMGNVNSLTAADEDDNGNAYNNVLFEEKDNELTVVYVEAVGSNIESLIIYRETKTVDMRAGDFTIGTPEFKNDVPTINDTSDLFNASDVTLFKVTTSDETVTETPVPEIDDMDARYRVQFTLTANAGVLFAEGAEPTLPAAYKLFDADVTNNGKTMIVTADIVNDAIVEKAVTADDIDAALPDDITLPVAPDTAGKKPVEVPENDVIESINTVWENKDGSMQMTTVEVTFADGYDTSTLAGNDEILALIAEKLSLGVDEDVEIRVAAMILAATSLSAELETADEPTMKITAATLEDGVLTLTVEPIVEAIELEGNAYFKWDESWNLGETLIRDEDNEFGFEEGASVTQEELSKETVMEADGKSVAYVAYVELKNVPGDATQLHRVVTRGGEPTETNYESIESYMEDGLCAKTEDALWLKLATIFAARDSEEADWTPKYEGDFTETIEFQNDDGEVVATFTYEVLVTNLTIVPSDSGVGV